MILCDQADPPEIFGLTVTGSTIGLIAIESDRSRESLAERLKSWYWGGLIRPDWAGLGSPAEAKPSYHVGFLMKIIERNPLHDWRVEELANRLRVSERTLNRSVQGYFGCTVKTLLVALRYQLLENSREIGQHSWDDLANLFGFSSAKELHRWRRDFERRRRSP